MVLVMVSGKAQSGKDTFFQIFNDIVQAQCLSGTTCRRFGFADKLKEIATRYGWVGGKAGEGRSFLIDVGQILRGEYDRDDDKQVVRSTYTGDIVERRTYDLYLLHRLLCLEYTPNSDFWVEACAATIKKELPDIAVITDWRFPNEGHVLPWLLGVPTTKIRIHRPVGAEAIQDPSETGLDGFAFDAVIENTAGLSDYRRNIERWFDNA